MPSAVCALTWGLMPARSDQEILDVLGKQRRDLEKLQQEARKDHIASGAISEAEQLLLELGMALPNAPKGSSLQVVLPSEPSATWDELVVSARRDTASPVRIEDLLSADDIQQVDQQIHQVREAVLAPYRLDAVDIAIAGLAGMLAGIVDIALVQLPPGAARLGQVPRPGGPLNTWVRDLMQGGIPENLRREFEASCKVPYDPSTNRGLGIPIPGLTPSTHRLHSLGHDPILGFIFGVADILRGTFTAIGPDGKLICQTNHPERAATSLFEAIARQFGHLLSDVNTPAGLPAPLMGLFQGIQGGKLTEHGYSVAELSRLMYRDGYDFRHFLATSIPVLLIEVLVRVAHLARQLFSGKSLRESVSPKNQPKLQTMLLVAHGTACGVNAGKIALSHNPLAISMAQWGAFGRYLLPEVKLRLIDLPRRSDEAVQALIDRNWTELDAQLQILWHASESSFYFDTEVPG